MLKIVAQAFPHGVTSGGMTESLVEADGTEDRFVIACGEVVARASSIAAAKGFIPGVDPFVVVVSFREVARAESDHEGVPIERCGHDKGFYFSGEGLHRCRGCGSSFEMVKART